MGKKRGLTHFKIPSQLCNKSDNEIDAFLPKKGSLRIPLSSHRLPTWTQKRNREAVLQHKIRFVQAWIEEEEQNL